MNQIFLVIDAPPEHTKETWIFCKDELPNLLKGVQGAIQIAMNIWQIDLHAGLSELPRLASVFAQKNVFCYVLDCHNGQTVKVSALVTSKERKLELEDINKKLAKM